MNDWIPTIGEIEEAYLAGIKEGRGKFEKENEELRKALEFYSDHETYCLYEDLSTKDWDGNFIAERSPNKLTQVGRLARTVLKKIQDD